MQRIFLLNERSFVLTVRSTRPIGDWIKIRTGSENVHGKRRSRQNASGPFKESLLDNPQHIIVVAGMISLTSRIPEKAGIHAVYLHAQSYWPRPHGDEPNPLL